MPTLIYQMGKVGSVSVKGYLEAQGRTTLHAHYIHNIAGEFTSARHHNMRNLFTKDSGIWKIITLVRDPIARNLSAFMWGLKESPKKEPKYLPERYKHQFINKYQHEWALNWFDFEFKNLLGLDIYNKPFIHELGYAMYPAKINVYGTKLHAEILVLRTENLLEMGPLALSVFLGTKPEPFPELNRTNFWFYERFKDELFLPESFVEGIYQSRLAQHFYSDKERKQLLRHWT